MTVTCEQRQIDRNHTYLYLPTKPRDAVRYCQKNKYLYPPLFETYPIYVFTFFYPRSDFRLRIMKKKWIRRVREYACLRKLIVFFLVVFIMIWLLTTKHFCICILYGHHGVWNKMIPFSFIWTLNSAKHVSKVIFKNS